jgi:hypothetical protein
VTTDAAAAEPVRGETQAVVTAAQDMPPFAMSAASRTDETVAAAQATSAPPMVDDDGWRHPPSRLNPQEARLELEGLTAEIAASESDWERCAPALLRAHLARAVCRLRSLDERAFDWSEATQLVHARLGLIHDLSRRCWPGCLQLLGRDGSPASLLADLRTTGLSATRLATLARDVGLPSAVPEDWTQAALLAAAALDQLESEAAASGMDDWGWADRSVSADQSRAPASPERLYRQVRRVVESETGPLGDEASGRPLARPGVETPSVRRLIGAARALRWLRGSPLAVGDWGLLAGRLRWTAQSGHLSPDAARWLRNVLEPTMVPQRGWDAELALDDESKRRRERRDRLLARRPGPQAPRQAVADWLRDAATGGLSHDEVRPLLLPEWTGRDKDAIVLLVPQKVHRDKVSRLLGASKTPPGTPSGGLGADVGVSDWETTISNGFRSIAHVLPGVLTRTRGLRTLFVGNRPDRQLQTRLSGLLETGVLDWCDISRGARSFVERVSSGSYDLVLAATGFIDHPVEKRFRTALPEGARIVRVDRGRPVATVLALARDFGLGG